MINGEASAALIAQGGTTSWETGTNTILRQLEVYDTVWIQQLGGNYIHELHSTFSVFLLYK
jgi:hypothetical protein